MSSDPVGEFASSFGGIILAAVAVTVLLLALLLAPVFAVASVPIAAYVYYRNSPAKKEKEARARTEALYRQALAFAPPDIDRHLDMMIDGLKEPAISVAIELYKLEGIRPPPPVPPICDGIEGARYRDQLNRYINTAHDADQTDAFVEALVDCLPDYEESEGIFRATAQLTNREIEQFILPFYQYDDHFRELKKVLDRNLLAQKGVMPSDYKGENCAFAYLKDTPLLPLEKRSYRVDLDARFEHTQIIAGSGSGKSKLIEFLVHHDLDLDEDACVIVIDSQKQLIDRLANIDIPIDEVAVFSPHHKLGINLFDMKAQGEEDVIAVVDLLEYVLSSLMDAELTTKQATLFNYAVHLLMTVPGANLTSLRQLLRKNGIDGFRDHVSALPETAREFFETEFAQQGYNSTKEEIMWRVDSMQRNPAFARIFGASHNPVDMFEEMKRRRLILIDTDVNHLGDRGSSFFGRFFIALILKASRQRFTGKHRPVYLYIDECAAYLDSRLELMLQQARKANIGVILAHQDLEKARSSGILSTILGNTATKFAGRLSDADARVMAANMGTTPDFLKALPRYHFGMSAIGRTTSAVSADVNVLQDIEQRIDHAEMVQEMERRYGSEPAAGNSRPDVSEPVQPLPSMSSPDDDIQPSSRM